MDSTRFKVLFEKVREAEVEMAPVDAQGAIETRTAELDEIRKLREFVSEISEPTARSYTTT